MQRPTVITVFGVLNIIFGGLALLCTPLSVLGMLMSNDPKNPMYKIIHESEGYRLFMIASVPLAVIFAVVLLAAGIGLLNMKPWARTLSIVYAVYAIVMGIAGVMVSFVFVWGPLMEQAKSGGPEAAAAMGGAIGGTVGGCFGLIYPILLLVFMLKADVIAAFKPALPDTGWPANPGTP